MVSKSDIILQFLSELRSCTAEFIPTDTDGNLKYEHVRLQNTDGDIRYPSLTYRFDERPERYGQGSKPQASKYAYDENGNKIGLLYKRYKRIRFDVKINTQDFAVMLQMGEAIDDQFTQYELWGDQSQDFHDHCIDVQYNGTTGADDPEQEPVSRNDIVDMEVEFYKYVQRDGTPIQQINENVTVSDS